MKQLLFLLLFPCLAMAQYQGNAGQKITLGEQTTADGLVWRGVASIDTVTATSKITRANKQDTSAFLLLDTVTNLLWHYKTASNGWIQAGGGVSVSSFSAGTTGLTPSTATTGAVTLGGTLAVANGGTNTSTAFTAGSVVFAGASGTYSQDNSGLFYNSTNDYLGVATASPNYKLHVKTGESGRTNHDSRMKIQIESELEAYYSINVPSGGYGGFRVHTTPSTAASAAFEYWAPNKKFNFLTGGFYEFNDKNNNKLLTIDSTGFIGINQVTPSERLHVVGNARITAVGAGTFANNLNITSDGTLTTATSDEKYKYNILPITYGLNTILQLKPVNFQWVEGEENDLGFIAQDVAEIIPEAVNTNWNSDLLMRYESIIPILTKAIQEQNLLIKSLEQRILILENK